jgi:glutamate synthase domain-containing protein 2/glutamate synthase domain-containing protein 1/glutamate synthase domain-containing protein 3
MEMFASALRQGRQLTGLYNPAYEHDACGVGFVADISGVPSRRALTAALRALDNLAHRGAVGADARTSDGAGILTQVPNGFLCTVLPELAGETAPPLGDLALGTIFLSRTDGSAGARSRSIFEAALVGQKLAPLAWRDLPIRPEVLGDEARAALPTMIQLVVRRPEAISVDEFERRLTLARREAERRALADELDLYVVSLSARTVVYKGLLAGGDLASFYPDLADETYETALTIFHQRYSTNTASTWTLAQPFRFLAHNGEINTVQGNRRWIAAREATMRGGAWGDRVTELAPITQEGGSDSASLDNMLEVLVRSGHGPIEALAILVGEGWEGRDDLDPARRAFYEYHAPLMEPWDGPAALAVSNGIAVGAALDRNGLRPARYRLTADGLLVVASEVGVLEPAGEETSAILESGRLGPGQMIAVDLSDGKVMHHDEIIGELAARHPYAEWVAARHTDLPVASAEMVEDPTPTPAEVLHLQRRYGYSAEDLRLVLTPMGEGGHEAIWSMGDDTPLAILSNKPRGLGDYFRQRFAQVTNPPIDPIRERAVMALDTYLGPRDGLLPPEQAPGTLLHLPGPILTPAQLLQISEWGLRDGGESVVTLPAFFDAQSGGDGLSAALDSLVEAAIEAIERGATVIVVSDRYAGDDELSAIPSLLAVAAVHQGLIRAGRRMAAEIVAESGDAWTTQTLALLIAYGAAAVCPWLAFASIRTIAAEGTVGTPAEAAARFVTAIEEGLLKLLSKMGISTVRSYQGSGLFEALGLSRDLVNRYFPGTPSPIGGIGLHEIAADIVAREEGARAAEAVAAGGGKAPLPDHGFVRYRRDGERHAYAPTIVKALQKMTESENGSFAPAAARFEELVASNVDEPLALRDLMKLVPAYAPLPIESVESVESIRKRFIATAMSLGALSPEAFTTLAAGMDLMGARSNSGEGGEDPDWYKLQPDGLRRHSRIKQIASARFGVTAEYLVHADEIEIKMAQGSKPGEGGQLPAHKVTALIARLRHAVPGTQLISPPPHHDIYSIEDLAQLIYDLRSVNPRAKIGVKLVATGGVGTIAAGVAKAGADYVLVSGHNGGTGASPLSSIKGAGLPWELGIAEAQQTLIRSGLRDRVRLRTDGGLRTEHDVVIAAALGAEDYGFGTAALVAIGCDMARQCHLNTCPAGIATQREDLRAKFTGTPQGVVRYFTWLAERVRALLAELGLSSLDDAVGRVSLLGTRYRRGRLATLDFSAVLAPPPGGKPRRHDPNWKREKHYTPLADYLTDRAGTALSGVGPARISASIRNRDRATGAELAGEIARRVAPGAAGGPVPQPIEVTLTGSAGQSFGAFCVSGLSLHLTGEANDYVGKSMSGGLLTIRPAPGFATAEAPHGSRPVLAGNTVLYGATGGDIFIAGAAGERFAVRNSGANAVVEGVGDHGCEYMTGGTVLILGPTGRNFAAGMSAGRAFILDDDELFPQRCSTDGIIRTRVTRGSAEANDIHKLLVQHQQMTGSARAAAILASWDEQPPTFWSVTGQPPTPLAVEPARPARPARREGAPTRSPIAVRRTSEAPDLIPAGREGGTD